MTLLNWLQWDLVSDADRTECLRTPCMHQTLHTPQRALTASQGREQPVLVSCQCDIGGLTAIESTHSCVALLLPSFWLVC